MRSRLLNRLLIVSLIVGTTACGTVSKVLDRRQSATNQALTVEESTVSLYLSDIRTLLEGDANRAYLRNHLTTVLAQLEPKYKEVLILRFFEEKDYNAIADILQKPPGTIATLINRAKAKCKTLLKEQFDLTHHDG